MSNVPSSGLRVPWILRRTLLAVILIAAAGAASTSARADYPERQITMIVCFPAGGGTDIAARLINTQLGEALGKPVIIENRGGAGGNIGIAAAARAGGDGYTLLVCSSAYVVNPSLYAQATYDPFKDFVPVMVIGASPNAFVVPAQSDIKTMPELVAKAKANSGKLNWTSPGAGTTPYLAGEVLKLRTGINMQHIPFPGAGPATTAVLAGQVDLYTANIGSLMGLIDAGKVRPIAVTSKECEPSDSPEYDQGDTHGAGAPPSLRHSNVEPGGVESNSNVAEADCDSEGGPELINVSGGGFSRPSLRRMNFATDGTPESFRTNSM